MIIPQTELFAFMMVALRTVGLFMFIPVFAGRMVPTRVRAGGALLVALLIFPMVKIGVTPDSHVTLIGYAMKEVGVGLMMGLAMRVIFYTVEFAGTLIAGEMGLNMAATFDPLLQRQNTIIATLLFYFAVMIMLVTGVFHEMLFALIRSFELMPIGPGLPGTHGLEVIVKETSLLFSLGLRMAAPVLAMNFIVNLTFAVLGKAAPKVPVFETSFAVRIIVGLYLMMLTLGVTVQYLYMGLKAAPLKMLEVLLR